MITFKEFWYFIFYIIKSPFVEIYRIILSIRFDTKILKSVTKPKFIVNLLIWIILINIVLGKINKTSIWLYIILIFAYIWKLWVAGEWRKELRDMQINKVIQKTVVTKVILNNNKK